MVIFGGGLGVPYFSTDTCAAQRALEIGRQVMLMGKNGVRGVFDADPKLVPDAAFFEAIQYDEVLKRGLKVADTDRRQPLHGQRPADRRLRRSDRWQHHSCRLR